MSNESLIGQPVDRLDGRLKVTGGARYCAEFVPTGMAYAALVESTIPAGRISAMDTSAAEHAPGVLLVLTHQNADRLPYQPPKERPAVDPVSGDQLRVLQDSEIKFSGQPIGLVVAATQIEAEHAASLIHVTYDLDPEPSVEFDPARSRPTSEAAAKKGRGPEARARRCRRRFRRSGSAFGPEIHPAARAPQCHGAARNGGALGG